MKLIGQRKIMLCDAFAAFFIYDMLIALALQPLGFFPVFSGTQRSRPFWVWIQIQIGISGALKRYTDSGVAVRYNSSSVTSCWTPSIATIHYKLSLKLCTNDCMLLCKSVSSSDRCCLQISTKGITCVSLNILKHFYFALRLRSRASDRAVGWSKKSEQDVKMSKRLLLRKVSVKT